MKNKFSNELENVRMSPIVSISEEIKKISSEFEKSGKPFIKFQRGEIDFPTPRYIIDAVNEGLEMGLTKYPQSGGENFFKDQILEKLACENKASGLSRENIIVTYGGQEALELSFKLFKKGAGFSPCWSCVLENFVPFSNINFKEIPLSDEFEIDYNLLEKTVKEIDFLYVNTPHNPTGKIFSEEELTKVAEICNKKNVHIISDEAYEKIVYDGKKHFSLSSLPLENIISAFTLSKTYSMTGWRLGYAVSRDTRIAKLLRLGEYSQTAGVVPFLQYAGKKALENKEESSRVISKMMDEYQKRRDLLYIGLSKIEGINVKKPEGAFYMFPNFSKIIPSELKNEKRNLYIYNLLKENGIGVVYGSCFGKYSSDNVRISFSTTPIPLIEEAISRMKKIFRK